MEVAYTDSFMTFSLHVQTGHGMSCLDLNLPRFKEPLGPWGHIRRVWASLRKAPNFCWDLVYKAILPIPRRKPKHAWNHKVSLCFSLFLLLCQGAAIFSISPNIKSELFRCCSLKENCFSPALNWSQDSCAAFSRRPARCFKGNLWRIWRMGLQRLEKALPRSLDQLRVANLCASLQFKLLKVRDFPFKGRKSESRLFE